MTVRLTPAEYTATRAKVAKIQARADKRGFTGGLSVSGERVEVTKTVAAGLEVTEVFYDVEISGEPAKYDGWTFLARIDVLASGAAIPACAPGVDNVDLTGVDPRACSHCGHDRQRKTTYVVADENGRREIVGSTCLKDFLGWDANPVFLSEDDVVRDVSGLVGSGERTFAPLSVVALAWACTRAFGFHRTCDEQSTAGAVETLLRGERADRDGRFPLTEATAPFVAEATEHAKTVVDFIVSDEFAGESSYVSNLKALVVEEGVTARHFGLLASAPQARIRHLETAAERAAKEARYAAERAAQAASEFVGAEGDKVEVTVTLTSVRYIEGYYGTKTLYSFITPDGNVVKWFSSGKGLTNEQGAEAEEGTTVTLKATVKAHEEYRGTKQTMLIRAKAV